LQVYFILNILAKYAENDPLIPEYSTFASNTSKFYFTIKDVRKYEDYLIKVLDYKLDYYTPYCITSFFIQHGIVFNDEILLLNGCKPLELEQKCYEVLNLFIQENQFLEYSSIQIALAVVLLVRDNYNLERNKMQLFYQLFKLEEFSSIFEKCARDIKK
jgi:hypothetical protein